MATTTPRRMLVFKIQKRLLVLSMSQIQTVASVIDDGSGKDAESLAALSEPELFDLFVDFLKSEKLRAWKIKACLKYFTLTTCSINFKTPQMEKTLLEELTMEESTREK